MAAQFDDEVVSRLTHTHLNRITPHLKPGKSAPAVHYNYVEGAEITGGVLKETGNGSLTGPLDTSTPEKRYILYSTFTPLAPTLKRYLEPPGEAGIDHIVIFGCRYTNDGVEGSFSSVLYAKRPAADGDE